LELILEDYYLLFSKGIYTICFSTDIESGTLDFIETIKSYKWPVISDALKGTPESIGLTRADKFSPPSALLEFPFLALLANSYIAAFNELSQCAPYSLVPQLTHRLEDALIMVVTSVKSLKREISFKPDEEKLFSRMCKITAEILIPHLSLCFSELFHTSKLIDLSIVDILSNFYEKEGKYFH